MPPDPSVFDFLNYRDFLAEWFRVRDGAPSMRGFAPSVPCSVQQVSAVVKGARDLDPEHAPRWAQALELEDEDADFFAALVELLHANSSGAREAALERALSMRQFRDAQRINQATLKLFSSWLLPTLAELAACPDFVDDAERVSAQVLPEASPEEVEQALADLEELGLITPDAQGQRRASPALHRTDHEAPPTAISVALMRLHRDLLKHAQQALDTLPGEQRHFTTITFALPEEALALLKERIGSVHEDLIQFIASAEGEPRAVYQLGVQLYPLARLDEA